MKGTLMAGEDKGAFTLCITHRVNSVLFSPDGKTLAGWTRGGPVMLWDTDDG